MRAIKAWKTEIIEALGGEAMITPQRRTLLELASRSKLSLDHADAYLLGLPSLINRRKKCFIPLVDQRERVAEALAKRLIQIGLDRVEKDEGTLPESWVTKVQPYPIEETEQSSPAPETNEDT